MDVDKPFTRKVTKDDMELQELRGILVTEALAVGIDPANAQSYPDLLRKLLIYHVAQQSRLVADHQREIDAAFNAITGSVELWLKSDAGPLHRDLPGLLRGRGANDGGGHPHREAAMTTFPLNNGTEVDGATGRVVGELDAWWAQQTIRTPKKYQVWGASQSNEPQFMLFATDDKAEAERCARMRATMGALGPVNDTVTWVLPNTPIDIFDEQGETHAYYLRVSKVYADGRRRETGPWAVEWLPDGWRKLIVRAELLRGAPDGTLVRDLGMTNKQAHEVVEMLHLGRLVWRNRIRKVEPVDIYLCPVYGGGPLCVRR